MTTTLPSVEDIQDALSAIVDAAGGRDLTDEEVAEVANLEADLEAARARRERTEAIRTRVAEGRKIATPALHVGAPDQPGDTLDAAFAAYLRTGKENADIQELRNAQSEGTASEGGFLVPDGFRQRLVDRMKAFGGIATAVDEITTDTGNNLPWPTLDDTGNVGEVVDEGGTFAGGADLVFGSASLGAYSYMAGGAGGNALRLPRELVQDSAFDVVGLVSAKLGLRMARIQATHLVTGTGVKQPQGIITGRTPVASAASTLTYSDLVNYVHSVDPAYRSPSCAWAFNDNTLKAIRKILDTTGRPLVKGQDERALELDAGGERLLGYRVVIDQGFPDIAANSTQIWGAFGDLVEGYIIRRVRQVEILVNPYSRMSNRQVEYSAWARMDAVQQNINAYSALTAHS